MTPADEMREQIAELEAAIRSLDPRVTQYVVMQGERAFQFEMLNRKPRSAKVVALPLATRFSEMDAKMIAGALKNSQGEAGQAVPLPAALKMALTRQQSALQKLEQAISVIHWLPRK